MKISLLSIVAKNINWVDKVYESLNDRMGIKFLWVKMYINTFWIQISVFRS